MVSVVVVYYNETKQRVEEWKQVTEKELEDLFEKEEKGEIIHVLRFD